MSLNYEEIDFRTTPIGDLTLRRRRAPQFGDRDIYEIKLGDDFLMTSLFHEAEKQLALLGLAALDREPLDVVVGGLGLGHTAIAALKDKRLTSLVVIDYLEAVIDWHQKGLVPLGEPLTTDPRCRLIHADFFALSGGPAILLRKPTYRARSRSDSCGTPSVSGCAVSRPPSCLCIVSGN